MVGQWFDEERRDDARRGLDEGLDGHSGVTLNGDFSGDEFMAVARGTGPRCPSRHHLRELPADPGGTSPGQPGFDLRRRQRALPHRRRHRSVHPADPVRHVGVQEQPGHLHGGRGRHDLRRQDQDGRRQHPDRQHGELQPGHAPANSKIGVFPIQNGFDVYGNLPNNLSFGPRVDDRGGLRRRHRAGAAQRYAGQPHQKERVVRRPLDLPLSFRV